jgi:hypothetical protein
MSQKDLNDFADWLVANPDKKGTPQYDTIAKAFRELDEQLNPVDRSYGAAFRSGIDQPLEAIGQTAEMLGFDKTGAALRNATDAPVNYESASDRFINPQQGDFTVGGFAPEYLPRAAVEQAGQFAGSLAARGAGLIGGGLVAGPGGAAVGALAGPALFEFAQQLGPNAMERARNNGRTEPNWEDWSAAAATAGVSGALNAIGLKGFGGASLLNRTLKEGATEGLQSLTEQTGTTLGTDKGLTVNPKQALGEAIIGGTSAGGVGVVTDTTAAAGRGARNLGTMITGGPDGGPTDPEAAAELADRLARIAQRGGPEGRPEFDLNDVDRMSQKGARAVVEAAHKNIAVEIKQAVKDLRQQLQVTDNDPTDLMFQKLDAQAGVEMARNKTKSVITADMFDAVRDLTGDTVEGRRLMSLMRQSNELTDIHNSGYQGGISRFTDQLSPLGSKAGYDRGFATLESIARPIASIGMGVTNPAIPAAQVAAVGAGRLIDRITGRRSRVKRYIEQNQGKDGISVPGGLTNIREERIAADEAEQQRQALEDAQAEQANLALTKRNAPPVPDSPQGRLEGATGMDRNGAARVIRMIERTGLGDQPTISRAIKTYRDSVAKGGYVEKLSPLIRAINAMQDSDPRIDALRVRPRDQNAEAQQQQIDARIEQGKRDNQAFNRQLSDALAADPSVDSSTKSIGGTALDKLQRNLGKAPLNHATAILEDAMKRAKNRQAIDRYVRPYVERVAQQQQANEPNRIDEQNAAPMLGKIDFETANDPMRVSTRLPTAKSAFENPLGDDKLQVNMDAIRATPGGLLQKMLKRLNAYEGAKGFRRDNKGAPADQQFKDFVKSNLLWLYNSVSPEYRARAKQWYVGANKLSQAAADQYGLSLPQVSGVMAALSPQQDWYMNYDIGIRVIDTFVNKQDEVFSPEMVTAFRQMMAAPDNARKRPMFEALIPQLEGKRLGDLDNSVDQAIFIRFYDEVNNPNGPKHRIIAPEGDLLDFRTNVDGSFTKIRMNGFDNIAKAIRMMKDGSLENISTNLGEKHKVRSFYNNILNPNSDQGDVTIDTHAVAAGLLQPLGGSAIEVEHNLGLAGDNSAITGVKGSYGIFADAYREAAAEAGVLPREMQSITWEAVRGLYTAPFKTKKNVKLVKDIWKKYDKGTISLEDVRGELYEIAGGIIPAAWEGRDGSSAERGGDALGRDQILDESRGGIEPGELLGDGVSGRSDGGRRIDGQSSGVLLAPTQGREQPTDTPLGAAIRDVLGPDRQYAPNSVISATRPATPTEVEAQLEAAEAILGMGLPIEIGKAGGAFENGIRSLQVIKRLAEAMNISFVLAKDMAEIRKLYGSKKTNAVGFYRSARAPHKLSSFSPDYNQIVVLRPGAKDAQGKKMDLGQATFVAMHELGHAIARAKLDPNTFSTKIPGLRKLTTGKITTEKMHTYYTNSLEGEVADLIKKRFGKNPEAVKEMLDEMVQLQRTSVIQVLDGQPAIVREGYMGIFEQIQKQIEAAGLTMERAIEVTRTNPRARKVLTDAQDNYEDYTQRAAELCADLLAVYAIDPAFMKQVAPKTARFARIYLNSADSGRLVQFYSAPFAAIVAAIMANLLVGEKEDEEEQRKRSGALSGVQSPGILQA